MNPVATPSVVRAVNGDSTAQTTFRDVNVPVGPGVVLEIRKLRGSGPSTHPRTARGVRCTFGTPVRR